MLGRLALPFLFAIAVGGFALSAGGMARPDVVGRTRPPVNATAVERARSITFPTPIQHVVLIYMENRTVDDLYSAFYNDPFPAGGGTWGQVLDLYNPVAVPTLAPNPIGAYFDPDHSHEPGFQTDAAGQWSSAYKGCSATCPPTASVYSYVPKPETYPYAAFAANFAFANHVLQSNEGPSFPAHQYAIAAQSGGIHESVPPTYAPFAAAENSGTPAPARRAAPDLADRAPVGNCFGPSNFVVRTVDATQPYPGVENPAEDHPPCAEYPTIFDSMVKTFKGMPYQDWQYIASREDGIWAAPMAVNHLYDAYVADPNPALEPFAVDQDALNFVANVTNGGGNPVRPFAALTYITPCLHESDHPISSGASDGPQWLAYVINAIGKSKYWPNTTIIVTWDDWGGFFDHYRPTGNPALPFHPYPNPYKNAADDNEWGFRVPLIVISPYVRSRGYVSTQMRSQGAILNYVESTFHLPSLKGDDLTNGSDNLGDIFNFANKPLPYIPVPSTFNPAQVPSTCVFG